MYGCYLCKLKDLGMFVVAGLVVSTSILFNRPASKSVWPWRIQASQLNLAFFFTWSPTDIKPAPNEEFNSIVDDSLKTDSASQLPFCSCGCSSARMLTFYVGFVTSPGRSWLFAAVQSGHPLVKTVAGHNAVSSHCLAISVSKAHAIPFTRLWCQLADLIQKQLFPNDVMSFSRLPEQTHLAPRGNSNATDSFWDIQIFKTVHSVC